MPTIRNKTTFIIGLAAPIASNSLTPIKPYLIYFSTALVKEKCEFSTQSFYLSNLKFVTKAGLSFSFAKIQLVRYIQSVIFFNFK